LARLDILQDILFARSYDEFLAGKQRRFQDTHLIAEVSPISPVKFDAYGRIDTSKMCLRELKMAFSLRDSDFWKVTLFSRHSKSWNDKVKQFGLHFVINASSRTSLSLEARYDAVARKVTKYRVGISTTLLNSWIADFGVIARKNAGREDKIQFDWHIRLLDF
jgi:hypothetical protein